MTRRRYRLAARLVSLCGTGLLGGCGAYTPLLSPDGPIGLAEKWTILTAIGLMLIVAIPVFVLTFWIAWRYRATNKNATYAPNWSYSGKIELVVWTVPALIVIALGTIVWSRTHALSPDRPIASAQAPIHVEAVAMDWKWLFIYPDQHIATVNRLVVPAGVPVSFRITSQTVMASFFIPQLGSQIYAMPGMRTKLNLLATAPGTYVGRNFQFSGRGYSSMHFETEAVTPAAFQAWVHKVQAGNNPLDLAGLQKLEQPSEPTAATLYSSAPPGLFNHVIDAAMAAAPAAKKTHA